MPRCWPPPMWARHGYGDGAAIEAGDLVVMSERIGALADVIRLARSLWQRPVSTSLLRWVSRLRCCLGALGLGACGWRVRRCGVSIISVLKRFSVLRVSARLTHRPDGRIQAGRAPNHGVALCFFP
jgi:hypothetical protein